jgi:hypothetical protein
MTIPTDNLQNERNTFYASPRIIILQVQSAFKYLLSKWVIIVAVALVTGVSGALLAYLKPVKYKAEITFAVDEGIVKETPSNFSVFSEQMGLERVDGGTVFSNINNISELLKSRLLIEKTLKTQVLINGKKILFIDFFLDSLGYRERWIRKTEFSQLNFSVPKKDGNEIRFENSVYANTCKTLLAKNIQISQKSKGTSIVAINCLSEHELFSKYFLEALVNEVILFYIDSKTQRSRQNLLIIQKRTDSIRNAYLAASYERASRTDADINLVRENFSVPIEKKQTDVQILRSAYMELSRTLESAKTSMMNETPFIQILDTPIIPLDIVRSSPLKYFLLFSFVGGFMIVTLLLLGKIYKYLLS